jgi:hypothetical protein
MMILLVLLFGPVGFFLIGAVGLGGAAALCFDHPLFAAFVALFILKTIMGAVAKAVTVRA